MFKVLFGRCSGTFDVLMNIRWKVYYPCPLGYTFTNIMLLYNRELTIPFWRTIGRILQIFALSDKGEACHIQSDQLFWKIIMRDRYTKILSFRYRDTNRICSPSLEMNRKEILAMDKQTCGILWLMIIINNVLPTFIYYEYSNKSR